MRIFIYQDNAIPTKDSKKFMKDFSAFVKTHLGRDVSYTIEQTDFSTYPTYIDEDGDIRPTLQYLTELTKEVEKAGKYAFDHVIMWVHEDNWRSSGPLFNKLQTGKKKGIWGTSYSYSTGNLHFEYCRFDKDNQVNTFGTVYHEVLGHPLDQLLKVETGKSLNSIAKAHMLVHGTTSFIQKNGFNWDRDFAHGGVAIGGHPDLDYIRNTENTELLSAMRYHINEAYDARTKRFIAELNNRVSMMQTILDLRRQVRVLLNQTNGVKSVL